MLVAAGSSVLIGIVLALGHVRLSRLVPAARSRILLAAAVYPLLCGSIFFAAATAGWLLHGQEDICVRHDRSGHISAIVVTSFLVFSVRGIVWAFGFVRDLRQSRRIVGNSCYSKEIAHTCRVLPMEEPQVFVAGILRPEIYVSEGLLSAFDREILEPVLAHEQAHVRHHDPLRRLIGSACLLFYVPGIGRSVSRLLARAQEIRADSEAADQIGDSTKVAEALVRLARLRLAWSASICEFGSGDLEVRIRHILRQKSQARGLSTTSLLLCGMASVLFAFAAASQLHLAAEFLLNLP